MARKRFDSSNAPQGAPGSLGGSEPGARPGQSQRSGTGLGARDSEGREGAVEGPLAPASPGPRAGSPGVGTRQAVAARVPLTCPASPRWAAGSQRRRPRRSEGASCLPPPLSPGPQRPRSPPQPRLPPPPPACPWRAEDRPSPVTAGKPQSGGWAVAGKVPPLASCRPARPPARPPASGGCRH